MIENVNERWKLVYEVDWLLLKETTHKESAQPVGDQCSLPQLEIPRITYRKCPDRQLSRVVSIASI